jgi:hypothetical protein
MAGFPVTGSVTEYGHSSLKGAPVGVPCISFAMYNNTRTAVETSGVENFPRFQWEREEPQTQSANSATSQKSSLWSTPTGSCFYLAGGRHL